jgi:hypothetical protein
MQNILINLNIISKIKSGNKIFINSDNFVSIENDTAFQGLLRFFYNNSRVKNINNINNFYTTVFNQVNDLIDSKYLNIYNSKYDLEHKCEKNYKCNLENTNFLKVYSELIEINHYIKLSINGLENLKQTYISDILSSSKIDIIITSVESYIKKINKKLEHIDSIKRIIEEDKNKKIK